ncbi:MAG: lysophospholipid acyltransferase family protein [Pseudomonadota bacterium]
MSAATLGSRWITRVGLAALRVMSWLPWRVQCLVGALIGRTLPVLLRRRVTIARDNLARVYPHLSDSERQDLLLQHRQELGISLFQTAVAWWSRDQRILKWTDVRGLGNLNAASNRPMILVAVHSTALEWLVRALGLFTQFGAVFRPFDHPVLDPVVKRGRLRGATSLISKHAPKGLPQHLRAGTHVFIAADQADTTDSATQIQFLGQPVHANSSVARLARKYDARVIPVHAIRLTNGRYEVRVYPELELTGEDDQQDTQMLNRAFEAMIALAPTQYFWVHRRFREDRE